jgi:molybdopterin molybdotransferase
MDDAYNRVLAEPVTALEDCPGFERSTMDGFAVRAADTFGAGESAPALFEVVGEIKMGETSNLRLGKGRTARIWTGGALPEGADAVVMIEHAEELGPNTVELLKAVAPFENVVRRGEDFRMGDEMLTPGRRLRPQDIGFLAANGVLRVKVFRKPAVGLVSSGDEIVPVESEQPAGCMRDVNRFTLAGMIADAHAAAVWIGIAKDTLESISDHMDRALACADMAVISGGSSMGSRDHVIEAILAHADSEILQHGVSISPGKPLIIARVGSKPVIGLPGHPVSAMVCFEQFVTPLLRRLEGENTLLPFGRPSLNAILSRNVPSKQGRTDYVRVKIETREGMRIASPVLGKSGVISSMVKAHGFFTIDTDCEGAYKGDQVTVFLITNVEDPREAEHLLGHEAPLRGAGSVFHTPRPELLSGV